MNRSVANLAELLFMIGDPMKQIFEHEGIADMSTTYDTQILPTWQNDPMKQIYENQETTDMSTTFEDMYFANLVE